MTDSEGMTETSFGQDPASAVLRNGDHECQSLESATLLVHIAFHFVEARLPYLRQVLSAFRDYRLRAIEIVVDTNDEATLKALSNMDLGPAVSLSVQVHGELGHPFLLTWKHRHSFAERHREFDYYLYLEDDIRVPWSTFAPWATELPILDHHGWLRGVLRVEPDTRGRLMASDWYRPMHKPAIYRIDGRAYLRTDNPYQACWCCTSLQLARFMELPAWILGADPRSDVHAFNPKFKEGALLRERASLGPIFAVPGRHRVLLPLSADGDVPESALVYHLPANYATNPSSRYGKIPATALITGRRIEATSVHGKLREARYVVAAIVAKVLGPSVIHAIRTRASWIVRSLSV